MNQFFKETGNENLTDTELFKQSEKMKPETTIDILDKPIAKEIMPKEKEEWKNSTEVDGEKYKNCPVNDGEWDGERGDSSWKPDREFIPKKSNPEEKTMGEIFDKYGIKSVDFKEGEPNFSEVSKGNVRIEPFSDSRVDNFDKADIELSKQHGCTPKEVRAWRKENAYTWHECRDMTTMQKVPGEIHNNITHSGGISEAKKGDVD